MSSEQERDGGVERELADAVPHVLWTHDGTGTATYFNRRWTEYTGASIDETIRLGPESFFHPADRLRVLQDFVEARSTGEALTTTYRLRKRDGSYRLHEARVVPVRGVAQNVTLWVGTATDVEDRERANEEQRYLAQASTILGTSLDMSRTLTDVARMLVPRLADWCAVDLLRDDGTLDRAAVEHVDPEKVELAWRLWKLLPPRPDAPQGAYAVMRTREPELLEVTDEVLAAAGPDPEVLEVLRGLGLRSSICVPLVARERALGALSLVTAESGAVYTARDVAFARDVAGRISVALDNARLYEEATHARSAAEALAADIAEQSKVVEGELVRMRGERDAALAELERARAHKGSGAG